jgi:hypothetical protein
MRRPTEFHRDQLQKLGRWRTLTSMSGLALALFPNGLGSSAARQIGWISPMPAFEARSVL